MPLGGNQADQEVAKFTGHERDPHGLSDYMRGRTYYYPLYRFGSVDPMQDGWNLYSYVRNNPIEFTDPSGYASQLVVGEQTENNVAGHVAIAIDGRVFSFGTGYVERPDWGVPLEEYLAAQEESRQTTLLELDLSPEQESELLEHLERNVPVPREYSVFSNSCVTVCENALESVGVLPSTEVRTISAMGHAAVKVEERNSLTPGGLAGRVRDAGLVKSESSTGQPKASKLEAAAGSVRSLAKRAVDRSGGQR